MSTIETQHETGLGVHVPALVWALAALAVFAIVFLLQENGYLLSEQGAAYLHEMTHDARHALGVPCH